MTNETRDALSGQICAIQDGLRNLPDDQCSVNGFVFDQLSKYQTRALCLLARVLLDSIPSLDSGSADRKLDLILARLDALRRQESHHMQELDDLTAEVKANTAAEQSAIVLINGIAARIAAAGVDPAALAALTADLKTNSDALAAAVVANTPPTA